MCEKTSNFEEIAAGIGRLVTEKNAAYGNSFEESGKILRILYPNGISISDYDNLLALVRIIDKIFRIAKNEDSFNGDSWADICGYALLMVARKEPPKEECAKSGEMCV